MKPPHDLALLLDYIEQSNHDKKTINPQTLIHLGVHSAQGISLMTLCCINECNYSLSSAAASEEVDDNCDDKE